MKIGILTRIHQSNTNAKINGIPTTYLNIIKEYCYPVLINTNINLKKNLTEIKHQIKNIDAFILPGGDYIGEIDLFIIDYCYKNDIPLLGICLGMQAIANYFNKDALNQIGNLSHFDMKANYLHSINLTKNGYLYNLLKTDTIEVNSRHKYHIKSDSHYEIEATSNNIIEAIKVKDKKYILGVQFHPEIMYEYDDNAKLIFHDFISQIEK